MSTISALSSELETNGFSIISLKASLRQSVAENARVVSENIQLREWLERNSTRFNSMETENIHLRKLLRTQSTTPHLLTTVFTTVEDIKPSFKFELSHCLTPSVMFVAVVICMLSFLLFLM